MTTAHRRSRPRKSGPHRISRREQHERKQRVLTQGMPSITESIAAAVVAKHRNMFFLAPRNGEIPLHGRHGFGLYYHDCRFLNGYEMLIGDVHPESLAATAAAGSRAAFQLTTPDVHTKRGVIEKETLGITWERILDADRCALYDKISVQNFGSKTVEVPIALTFGAGFEDLFAIRGMVPDKFGTMRPPSWQDEDLFFLYEGADGLYRSLTVRCSPSPAQRGEATAAFRLALEPEERRDLLISLVIRETDDRRDALPRGHMPADLGRVVTDLERSSQHWLDQQTQVESNALLLNRVIHRSLLDLHVLQSRLDGDPYFAAGVPWFVTLFGRDSLITSLQTLAFHPAIAEGTLRLLARYQGQKTDGWRDEQPGKILHELRVGEMARLNEIPQTPYYGSIDSTLLFLILIARHAAWTGSLALFHDLHPSVDRALEWVDRYGDSDGDDYLDYKSSSEKGLVNQGWKDSGNAIVNRDGSLAEPPIALAEVQGYVYMAKERIADLYRRAGEQDRADRLVADARRLRERFNDDYWMAERGCFALAREARGRACTVISSNAGQVLWTGIADESKARCTADRLMESDMFSGWGIRTLAATERRYNPIGYHLGTVWPHDNSLIAAGFRRYGCDEHAARIFTAILEAAMEFEHHRLPEVFAGFSREDYGAPVHYPVACHPQAWAAGSVPYLVETSLGLVPEAFEQRLRIVRPSLPVFIHYLELRNLRVGAATVDLRFERGSDGAVRVDVPKRDGLLDIRIDPAHPASV